MPWLGNAQSNAIVIPSLADNWPTPVLPPPRKPGFRVQAPPLAVHLHSRLAAPAISAQVHEAGLSNVIVAPSTSRAIPPGVYKTVPYSCIVVVPGPCPDDRAIVSPGGGDYSMPIIRPDLRFIPWGPAR